MTAQALPSARFLRKTTLGVNEYNTNFQMIDREVMKAVSSVESDAVTPLMSKIYLRLLQTPTVCMEREGVLRFEGEILEGKWVKAWDQLCRHLRVSSETARKALSWMHNEGVIGYSAFKNGVGIRIFLNRAANSIALKPAQNKKKNLPLAPASLSSPRASESDTAFKDSYAVLDSLEKDINSHAPKNGADSKTVNQTHAESIPAFSNRQVPSIRGEGNRLSVGMPQVNGTTVDELVERLKGELEPCVRGAAARAASQATAHEMALTRKWFEERALPKAVRVAQHETYDLLKKLGTLDERKQRIRAELQVGRAQSDDAATKAVPLTTEEITNLAKTCIALFETQGKNIDVTLAEISAQGTWLLPEDAGRVREASETLLRMR